MRRHPALRSIALASAALALAPASAMAARHSHFGGFFLKSKSPLALRLNASRTAIVAVNGYVAGTCSDGSALHVHAGPGFKGAKVSGGRFTASSDTPLQYGGQDGTTSTGTLHETMTGRITRDGTATGTYSAATTLTRPDGTTVDCTTGTLKWGAESDPLLTFEGATSQGLPIVVDSLAKKVRNVLFAWRATCTRADGTTYTNYFPEIVSDFRLSRSFHWGAHFTNKEADGTTASYTVGGTLGLHKATGTLSVTVTSTAGTTCRSGKLRYTAIAD